ncbi:MAG: T9SS type A sorting domain-containing protein, partial [Cryomorphaceae bacterium]
ETELTLEPLGSPDLFLASYDDQGSLNWVFSLGRISLNDGMRATGLGIDSDGNIVISGGFSLNVDFDPSENNAVLTAVQGQDGFLAKYDSSGQLIWTRQFGSTAFDAVSALVIDDSDNKVIGVRFGEEIDLDPSDTGENIVAPVGGIDAAVVKLDSDGNYVWSYLVAPDINNESVSALAANSNGDIAMGATVNAVSTGIPVQGMLAGILDTNGSEIWAYDFQNQGQSNVISHVAFSQDEQSIYLGGRIQEDTDFDPSANEEVIAPLFADPFLSKHAAADGSLTWVKYVESSATEDYCAGVHENNGVVFLAGSFDVSATFIPDDFTSQVPSNGASDVFVAVYEANSGDFIEAETFGGTGGEKANDAFFAGSSGLSIVGQFSSSLSLVEGESISAAGFEDGFRADFTYLYDLSTANALTEKDVNIYPVPAIAEVFIQLSNIDGNSTQVKLINIIGQTVFESDYRNSTDLIKIDISKLNQGVYLAEITTGGGSITKRLIKQ